MEGGRDQMYYGSNTFYTEQYSISFGDVVNNRFIESANTWTTWHLIPSSRPSVSFDDCNFKFIEIPGTDGMLNISSYLNGTIQRKNRTGSFAFMIANGFENHETIREKIARLLHGKRTKMVLADDPYYYYEGSFTVSAIQPGTANSSITLTYELDPDKKKINSSSSVPSRSAGSMAENNFYTETNSILFINLNSLNESGIEVLADTWSDWHLIPVSRPEIVPPDVRKKQIEIPGKNGADDIYYKLFGKYNYGFRRGSLNFHIDNGHEHYETIREKMITMLHGKKHKMVLKEDPAYYYEGYFTVGNITPSATYSQIAINYQLNPYKMRIKEDGSESVIWDTFNFETDYDYYSLLNRIEVNGTAKTYNIVIQYSECALIADYISGNQITISLNGSSKTISSTERSKEIGYTINGNNVLTVNGNGVLSIHFRGGSL